MRNSQLLKKLSQMPKLIDIRFLLIVGFLLRLVLSIRQKLWIDEGVSWEIAHTSSFLQLVKGEYNYDPQPPLHYVLIKVSLLLFGESALSVRFFSIIFGIGLIWLIYQTVLIIVKKRKTALLAAALCTFSPILVWYSSEARMYSYGLFFQLLTLYEILNIEDKGQNTKRYILIGLSWLAASLSTFSAIYLLPGLLLYKVYLCIKYREHYVDLILSTLVLCFTSILSFSWFYYFVIVSGQGHHAIQFTNWIPPLHWRDLLNTALNFLGFRWGKSSLDDEWGLFYYFMLSLLSVLVYKIISFRFTIEKKLHDLTVLGLILLIVPLLAASIISLTLKPVFLTRQLLLSGVGFILLLPVFIEDDLKKDKVKIFTIGIVTVMFYALIYNFIIEKSYITTALEKINDIQPKPVLIITSNEVSSSVTRYYSHSNFQVLPLERIDENINITLESIIPSENPFCFLEYSQGWLEDKNRTKFFTEFVKNKQYMLNFEYLSEDNLSVRCYSDQ